MPPRSHGPAHRAATLGLALLSATATVGVGAAASAAPAAPASTHTTPAGHRAAPAPAPAPVRAAVSGPRTSRGRVTFSTARTTVPTGARISSYRLDFGDRSRPAAGPGLARSVSHTYARPGSFLVTLTVLDTRRRTVQAKTRVAIAIDPVLPVARGAVSPAGLPRPVDATWVPLPADVRAAATGWWDREGASMLAELRNGECTDWASQQRPDIIRAGDVAVYGDALLAGTDAHFDWTARFWAGLARRAGLPVSDVPSVGAIAVFQPGVEGAAADTGHVSVVEQVNPDGTFVTSDENVGGPFVMAKIKHPAGPMPGREFIPR